MALLLPSLLLGICEWHPVIWLPEPVQLMYRRFYNVVGCNVMVSWKWQTCCLHGYPEGNKFRILSERIQLYTSFIIPCQSWSSAWFFWGNRGIFQQYIKQFWGKNFQQNLLFSIWVQHWIWWRSRSVNWMLWYQWI